jgi:hypothetical protein
MTSGDSVVRPSVRENVVEEQEVLLVLVLIEYLNEVIAEPPVEAGALKATLSERLPGVTEVTVGAPGAVGRTTVVVAVEVPDPTELTARNWIE